MVGGNQVDLIKVIDFVDEFLGKVDVVLICSQIGFVIGGVFFVGYLLLICCWIDLWLLEFEKVWVVVGILCYVFLIELLCLFDLIGGIFVNFIV